MRKNNKYDTYISNFKKITDSAKKEIPIVKSKMLSSYIVLDMLFRDNTEYYVCLDVKSLTVSEIYKKRILSFLMWAI